MAIWLYQKKKQKENLVRQKLIENKTSRYEKHLKKTQQNKSLYSSIG